MGWGHRTILRVMFILGWGNRTKFQTLAVGRVDGWGLKMLEISFRYARDNLEMYLRDYLRGYQL